MFLANDNAKMQKRRLQTLLFITLAASLYLLVVVPLVKGITTPNQIVLTPAEYVQLADKPTTQATGNAIDGEKYITLKLLGFIPFKKVMVDILPFDTVLIGGTPIGLCGAIDGVLVTDDHEQLKIGDIIQAVNNVNVQNIDDFETQTTGKDCVQVTISRHGKILNKNINVQDICLRDTTNGVGILTFVNPVNNNFSALGHQMADFETGANVNLHGGTVHDVKTYGVVKTQNKKTGVIQSSINNKQTPQGSITRGTAYGVTGCLTPDSNLLAQTTTTLPVTTRYFVKPGKATLRTCLDGTTVEEFDCEILKTRYQNHKSDKSMIIRITDPRLIEKTGGIVHGMSGSPIIQNGHLVGALTHAITHDPTKGYAIYVDFMAI